MADDERFESFIDRAIREATERREFDDLPGAGAPLPLLDEPVAARYSLVAGAASSVQLVAGTSHRPVVVVSTTPLAASAVDMESTCRERGTPNGIAASSVEEHDHGAGDRIRDLLMESRVDQQYGVVFVPHVARLEKHCGDV